MNYWGGGAQTSITLATSPSVTNVVQTFSWLFGSHDNPQSSMAALKHNKFSQSIWLSRTNTENASTALYLVWLITLFRNFEKHEFLKFHTFIRILFYSFLKPFIVHM